MLYYHPFRWLKGRHLSHRPSTIDHRPAHVHVIGKGGEAVFILNCPGRPPELRESYRFNSPALKRIASTLAAELLALCAKWREIHGYD
jgi:hypothetical protein